MNVFDVLREKLTELKDHYNKCCLVDYNEGAAVALTEGILIVNQVEQEYNNGWIACSERLPKAEEEVLIQAKRKYRDGTYKTIITNAMYEDGTVRDNDSCWYWEDVDGEWDEEEDCLIIPKGWWESKHYNPDGVLNYAIDDEVIAWQPLPQQYKESENERFIDWGCRDAY